MILLYLFLFIRRKFFSPWPLLCQDHQNSMTEVVILVTLWLASSYVFSAKISEDGKQNSHQQS